MTLAEANKAQRRQVLRNATPEDLQHLADYWSQELRQAERARAKAEAELAEVLLEKQERQL